MQRPLRQDGAGDTQSRAPAERCNTPGASAAAALLECPSPRATHIALGSPSLPSSPSPAPAAVSTAGQRCGGSSGAKARRRAMRHRPCHRQRRPRPACLRCASRRLRATRRSRPSPSCSPLARGQTRAFACRWEAERRRSRSCPRLGKRKTGNGIFLMGFKALDCRVLLLCIMINYF